jgi:nicotinamidase-related amidase
MLLIVDAQVNQFEPPMAVHDGPLILGRLKSLVARARAANVPVPLSRTMVVRLTPTSQAPPAGHFTQSSSPSAARRSIERRPLTRFTKPAYWKICTPLASPIS